MHQKIICQSFRKLLKVGETKAGDSSIHVCVCVGGGGQMIHCPLASNNWGMPPCLPIFSLSGQSAHDYMGMVVGKVLIHLIQLVYSAC